MIDAATRLKRDRCTGRRGRTQQFRRPERSTVLKTLCPFFAFSLAHQLIAEASRRWKRRPQSTAFTPNELSEDRIDLRIRREARINASMRTFRMRHGVAEIRRNRYAAPVVAELPAGLSEFYADGQRRRVGILNNAECKDFSANIVGRKFCGLAAQPVIIHRTRTFLEREKLQRRLPNRKGSRNAFYLVQRQSNVCRPARETKLYDRPKSRLKIDSRDYEDLQLVLRDS